MSDIFISYKREEQPVAKRLADALSHQGWDVWWDPKLRAGERFNDVIERELGKSRCVIVLWSKRSVESQYVKDEALFALSNKKLIPVAIEEVNLPFRFQTLHTVELLDGDDLFASPAFQNLVDDIRDFIRSPRKSQNQEIEVLSNRGQTRVANGGESIDTTQPPKTDQKFSLFGAQLDIVFIVAVSYAGLLLLFGVAFEPADPYLKFYMAGSGLWLLMFISAMKFSANRTQNILIGGICFLTATIASAGVIWRYYAMRDFCASQTPESPPPFGFAHDPEYLPYLYVVGMLLVVVVAVLLKYLRNQDEKYRTAVFRWLGGLFVWLIGSRVAWYFAERCYQVYK